MNAQRTSPPIQACVGGRSVFAVEGNPGSSFSIEVMGGEVICRERYDSIVVQWDTVQGMAYIRVKEIPDFDPWITWARREMGLAHIEIPPECQEGEWVYIDVDLRGRRFQFEVSSIPVNPGANPNDVLPINRRLYRNIHWFDPDGNQTERFERPGLFKVRVEDMHGCMFTDTITITINN